MSETIRIGTCPKCQGLIPPESPEGLCPRCVLGGAAIATEAGQSPTATTEIPSIERIAAAFPQLEIVELIGRGGMGFVFKARQPHLDRFVALKLLPDKLARDPHFAERFNREGKVLARLSHPNIVSVFDFGQANGFYFLLMEYVDGVNLRQAMRAGRFSAKEALQVVPKICEALHYAHEQGVLHRDIKPENILLDSRGRVKIADFGIAKLVGEEAYPFALTATGAALGTPHYMAPEQLQKPNEVDQRADIYSLGVVFYEMLTGELPMGRFGPPSSRTPLDQRIDAIVMRALERERELRQKTAGEMKTQVEHVAATPLPTPLPRTPGKQTPLSPVPGTNERIMHWVAWALAILCLVNFLFPHVTRLGNSTEHTFTVGLIQPWLARVPLVGDGGAVLFEWRFNPRSSSLLTGLLGVIQMALIISRRRKFSGPFYNTGRKASNGVNLLFLGPLTLVPLLFSALFGERFTAWDFAHIIILGFPAALAATILGWVALSEIRGSAKSDVARKAMIAAFTWPLIVMFGLILATPIWVAQRGSQISSNHLMLVLLGLPVSGVLVGLALRAGRRWANEFPAAAHREFRWQANLGWIIPGIVVTVATFILVTTLLRRPSTPHPVSRAAPPVMVHAGHLSEAIPKIQFTFTAVDLRSEGGERWLAIDYAEDVQGSVERAFRWEARAPGFTGRTRTTAMLLSPKGSPTVRHQRTEFLLPPFFPEGEREAQAARDILAKTLIGKSILLKVGEEKQLFHWDIGPDGLSVWITVVPTKNPQ